MFASNMLAGRWISGTVPALTLTLCRWLIVALVLTPFVLRPLKASLPIMRGRIRDLAVLAFLGGTVCISLQYSAARFTSAGHIALVFAMTPILVTLLDRLIWKTALPPAVMLGAMISFAGIGIVVFEGRMSRVAEFEVNLGDLLAFIGAVAWALYTSLLRRRKLQLPPLVQLWTTAAGSAFMLIPLAPLEWWLRGGAPVMTASALGTILLIALVAGIGAYAAYGKVVSALGPSRGSTSMYLIPVYAFLGGAALLGEPLHWYHLTASALVFGGVAFATVPLRFGTANPRIKTMAS
ncbi:DMT family transporter [Cupriavidus sp. 30B13]|uniref:DMT family transporter n=1 Tax=Cupriavidus sp. 30B13 TaxID=3384241 RepID=UPI003CF56198